MGKKRFFDDRLKYLSFIQNTGEKKAISEKIYSHIASLSQNKSYIRVLDAGTGDGTIFSNIVKSFHRYHPYTSLLITGKEVSYEDLKNTLEKTPDRFVEHPNLLITMSNVKFSELGSIESSNTDVTTELTTMIKAQQLFSGASKLLQTEVEMVRSIMG